MARRRQVVVIGLGRFGSAVARALVQAGHEVLAVDVNRGLVQAISDEVTHAVQADGTDADALGDLGAGQFEVGIVGISSDLERSILATVQLKRLGVRYVIAKAQTELHGEVLAKVGADRVVYPERETGERVAHSFSAPSVLDYMPLGPEYGISKISTPPALIGRAIGDLNLHEQFQVTLLLIERGHQVLFNPRLNDRLRPDDILVIAGEDDAMERMQTEGR